MAYSHFVAKHGNDINNYVKSKGVNYVGMRNIRTHFNAPRRYISKYMNEHSDIFEYTDNANLVGSGKYKLNLWRFKNNISMNIEVVE